MLRFLSERRVWVVAAFVALAFAIGLWFWAMPRLTAHASDLISERLGVDAQIQKARLSFGGVELLGVELHGRHGGFDARIDRVNAQMSLLGAVFNGAGSVRALSAAGLEVTVDLGHEGFGESIGLVRNKNPRRASVATSSETMYKKPLENLFKIAHKYGIKLIEHRRFHDTSDNQDIFIMYRIQ